MQKTTFQDRVEEAIERAGSQTLLADKVSLLVGRKITPQAISKLASRTIEKPARASSFTGAMAVATGLSVNWLAHGIGPKDAQPGGDPEAAQLFDAAAARLAAGGVSDQLRDSLFALLRAIVEYPPGNPTRSLTAAEPENSAYSHGQTTKKVVTG